MTTASASRRRQLGLPIPPLATDPGADLVVGPSTEAARTALARPQDWPGRALALIGPPGSGKSRLAADWAHRHGASIASAAALGSGAALSKALVLEDLDPAAVAEAALLALLDRTRAGETGPLLMTAISPPWTWGFHTPDLVSRVRTLPTVTLRPPTDEELVQVLQAEFAARGLGAEIEVARYVVLRLERTLAAARRFVDLVDARALAEKRGLTRRLAQEVLDDDHSGPGRDDHGAAACDPAPPPRPDAAEAAG